MAGNKTLRLSSVNLSAKTIIIIMVAPSCSGYWRCGVVVITTAQLHSTKPELRFYGVSNTAHGVSEIRDSEDLWQWSLLEISLNTFPQSTITQKQFIIIIISSSSLFIIITLRIPLKNGITRCRPECSHVTFPGTSYNVWNILI